MTLWKEDRFSLVQECHISYDDYVVEGQDGRFRTGHVGVIVELRPLEGQNVVVANTHLACGLIAEDVRLWQLSILLTHLQHLDANRTVLCGDFNSIPGGYVHSFLSSRFRSVFADVEAGVATSSNALSEGLKGFADTIDYCWLLGTGAQAVQRARLPSKEELRRLLKGRPAPSPIPTLVADGTWPSDHLPIVVDLAFANEATKLRTHGNGSANGSAPQPHAETDVADWSKKLSWILRHGGQRSGLQLDTEGWVTVKDLLQVTYLEGLTEGQLDYVVEESNREKRRYEFWTYPGGRAIRAIEKRTTTDKPDKARASKWKVAKEQGAGYTNGSNPGSPTSSPTHAHSSASAEPLGELAAPSSFSYQ